MSNRKEFEKYYLTALTSEYSEKEDKINFSKLRNFVKRSLRQYELYNIEVDEVLNTAYLRGVELIEKGEKIENPIAWMRVTSFNVIRELSRKQQKQRPFDSNWIENQMDLQQPSYDFTLEDTDDFDIKLLKQALQQLKPQERQILVLREVEGLSWKEVVEHLRSCGETVSETTARQRGRRSLDRLKKIYGCLKPVNLSTTAL